MTTRGAVACLCSEVLRDEELGGAPLLLDAGGVSMADRDPAKMAAERAAKFIFRVRHACSQLILADQNKLLLYHHHVRPYVLLTKSFLCCRDC